MGGFFGLQGRHLQFKRKGTRRRGDEECGVQNGGVDQIEEIAGRRSGNASGHSGLIPPHALWLALQTNRQHKNNTDGTA
jgi:hypothetical protein